jgi:hypothetical protein
MLRVTKEILSLIVVVYFLFIDPTALFAEWIRIYGDPTDQTMSVDIKQAPLKSVIDRIKAKKRIWVKGAYYLSDNHISVKFKDLTIEEGMKRILSTINHSLMFDQKGNLLGVVIVKTRDSKWTRSSASSGRSRRRPGYRRR